MELILFPFERVVQINVFILENEFLADVMRDLVLNKINDSDFADILYAQYLCNK